MVARKRRHQSQRLQRMESSEQKQRDDETVRHVETLLSNPELEVTQLRKLAAARGLANSRLRAKVWPLLLGIETDAFPYSKYDDLAHQDHSDTHTLKADIARSLWSFTQGWTDEARDEKRKALMRLINAAVNYHAGDVRYYQGLHDIASVLLLTVGEHLAFPILCRLVVCHLRDCTRPSLEPVAELLELQVPILAMTDPGLARVLEGMQIPCYFALSWYITWFSHDVQTLTEVARLFDLFLSAHPMMPLYVGAACMAAARDELVNVEDMSLMHQALVNLRVGKYMSTDELIRQALALYSKGRPKRIVRRRGLRLQCAVAPDAYKVGCRWEVPDAPVPRPQFPPFASVGRWCINTVAGGLRAGSLQGMKVYAALSVSGLVVLSAYFVTKVMEHQMNRMPEHEWVDVYTDR